MHELKGAAAQMMCRDSPGAPDPMPTRVWEKVESLFQRPPGHSGSPAQCGPADHSGSRPPCSPPADGKVPAAPAAPDGDHPPPFLDNRASPGPRGCQPPERWPPSGAGTPAHAAI
ncbi:unnamed protein product [Lampetra planeri]